MTPSKTPSQDDLSIKEIVKINLIKKGHPDYPLDIVDNTIQETISNLRQEIEKLYLWSNKDNVKLISQEEVLALLEGK